MKKKTIAFTALVLGVFFAFAGYKPEACNLEVRQKLAEQRFGIFIHWGLYANYAQGEWYQQQIGMDTATY